jgi:hypothetical protein
MTNLSDDTAERALADPAVEVTAVVRAVAAGHASAARGP